MEKFEAGVILSIVCIVILILIYFLAEIFIGRMRKKFRGKIGEGVTNRLFSTLNPRKYILFKKITLPTTKGIVTVDHVLISTYGVFVVESIDWGGKVSGTKDDEKWMHIDSSGHEHYHPNPVVSNAKRVKTIQHLLGLGFDDFIPIIAFVAAVDLDDVDVDIPVANINNLINIILSYRDKRFTRKQIRFLANEIKAYNTAVVINQD